MSNLAKAVGDAPPAARLPARAGLDEADAALYQGLSAPCAVLFALHLYQLLPQLIPKTMIDFAATLGAPARKTIELRNPSARAVRYDAVLEGSSDFVTFAQTVSIDPKASTSFLVELNPRFSKPVEARLTFYAERGADAARRAAAADAAARGGTGATDAAAARPRSTPAAAKAAASAPGGPPAANMVFVLRSASRVRRSRRRA